MAGENELVQGYRFAGDIEINQCILVSQSGQVQDIGDIALEINVYQSLYEHYLQCDVVISDAVSLWNSFKGDREKGIQGGFNGGEVLILSYKTRDKDMPLKTHFFGIYEISDRQRVNEKLETYVLNCISAEAYNATTQKISRALGTNGGNTISNMMRGIVDEYVYSRQIKDLHRNYRDVLGFRIQKEVYISPTNGLQKFILPNMTVDDTIDFLCNEADCDNHVPLYMFYETSKGFNFRDLNSIVAQEPKEEYTYVQTNVKDEDQSEDTAIRDFQKIISYNIIKMTNILDNAQGGLFRSKMINLDILRKNKSEYVFNYENEYSKFNKLQKWKIPGSVSGMPLIYMMQSRTGHDTDTIFADEKPLPKRINQHLTRANSFERHIFNTMMDVTVPGNSDLDVGDVIRLNIPNATTLDKSDGKRDKYISGKYVISKIRHKFGGSTGSEFTTILECVKDTGIEI